MLTPLSAWSQALRMTNMIDPEGDWGSTDLLRSIAGEIYDQNPKRHQMLWLTITVADQEHFVHWLVGDLIPSESPRSTLTAAPEDGEWLLQSKEFQTWRTEPHSFLWLYSAGKSVALWLIGPDPILTSH